jgi:hypothetical protein
MINSMALIRKSIFNALGKVQVILDQDHAHRLP